MASFCLFVKPSGGSGTLLLSLTQLGPVWSGPRLALRDPARLGLAHGDVVGWSDFYAGCACDVKVARATDGTREGWLIWGGTLGVRILPSEAAADEAVAGGHAEEAPVLWVDDLEVLPRDVAEVVAGSWMAGADAPRGERRRPPGR